DHHFTLYQWVEANVRWDLVIVRWPKGAEAGCGCRSAGGWSGPLGGWVKANV
ncbi:MAG: hypothetical protein JO161_05035, partial [Planctomycetaceae bacterium]|nr:hypothetical protein [Planctomycetaceae bacterium]